jgi:hypothetical protein
MGACPVSHESFPKYDRRAMIDDPQHPAYPDRRPNGQFRRGHPKIGGRRWTGGPRRTSKKIRRLFQKYANKRAREEARRIRLATKWGVLPMTPRIITRT